MTVMADVSSTANAQPDPVPPAVTDRRPVPRGVLPRGVQTWIMAGVAAAPWLLPRIATAPGVYEARKSLGWATLLFGLIMLTVSSVAVFMRDAVMDFVGVEGIAQVPDWLSQLVTAGRAEIEARAPRLNATSIALQRDAVLFALPSTLSMPAVMTQMTLAGAVAAALAGAGAAIVALGNVLAEDVVTGLAWEPPEPEVRLWLGRFGIVIAALTGGAIAQTRSVDWNLSVLNGYGQQANGADFAAGSATATDSTVFITT